MIGTRPVSSSDLELICHHREALFRESGGFGASDNDLETMTAHFRAWLSPRLKDGSYFGFIADDGNAPVAGIGLVVVPWAPHPFHPVDDKRGYILNVYVEPSHRRKKIGDHLMKLAEDELRRRGLGYATLHATESGSALYQTLGWAPTTEMSKKL